MKPTTPQAILNRTVSHLDNTVWQKVNRLNIKKAIEEFAHELLIEPQLKFEKEGWAHYSLVADDASVVYNFRAKRMHLDHWCIDKASIEKYNKGTIALLNALDFIIEFKERLKMDADILAHYLEEISSTLYGAAYMHSNKKTSSEELVSAGFQEVEGAMMAGHPCFIANNGRIGFDANDYVAYAPEVMANIQMLWVAGHKSKTSYAGVKELGYDKLMLQELGEEKISSFNEMIAGKGLLPEDYIFMPVHPWQWFNKLVFVFASDIANNFLICLGYGNDAYQAQQSIRTFFNKSNPGKYYVKTALSILNMGFMRGLSPYYMATTPPINDWVKEQIDNDAYLQHTGFAILREVATVGYRNTYCERAIQNDSPYKKMIAALWRENPLPALQSGQRLMTMASFLHIDVYGKALLPLLIQSSGLDTSLWLKKYLNCYLSPILHCFYQHEMVFMPHGENLIIVLENNVPVKAYMKDIAEEVGVLSQDKMLPTQVERLSFVVPDEFKLIYIFTDIFDCFFRFVASILEEHMAYGEDDFWRTVADCILTYQQAHPHLESQFEKYDLFMPEIKRCCLNRLQMAHHRQMVVLSDPIGNLKFEGTLKNPIAVYKNTALAEMA
ncbi:MAG: IucA/IucC family protein [Agriterribacter sp.]